MLQRISLKLGMSAPCIILIAKDQFCSIGLPITLLDCQYENVHAQQCVDSF